MSVTFRNESDLKYLIDFMKTKGLTENGIAALLANIYAESGFVLNNLQNSGNTKLGLTDQEYTIQVDAGSRNFLDKIGYGWCQWTSSSRKNCLKQLSDSMKLSIASKEVQTAYIYQELSKSYKSTLAYLTDPNRSLSECTIRVMVYYEAPANAKVESYQQKRVDYAVEIYSHFFPEASTEESHEVPIIAMKPFYPRTVRPVKGDVYISLYNNTAHGGISKCIDGKPMDSQCTVLANCTGYSCGRFNETYNQVTGFAGIKYSWIRCHAKNIPSTAKLHGLHTGDIPQYGAMLCWQGGSSNCGHVVVVEEIYSSTSIRTSDSGYNHFTFQTTKRMKSYGNGWSTNTTYKNPKFVYNPAYYDNKYDVPSVTLYKGCKKGNDVKWLQTYLVKYGYLPDESAIDGSFGAKTEAALKLYQKDHLGVDGKPLEVDGRCGGGTKISLLNCNIEVRTL